MDIAECIITHVEDTGEEGPVRVVLQNGTYIYLEAMGIRSSPGELPIRPNQKVYVISEGKVRPGSKDVTAMFDLNMVTLYVRPGIIYEHGDAHLFLESLKKQIPTQSHYQ